jgi:formate hydrogenlyase transcriptional activator
MASEGRSIDPAAALTRLLEGTDTSTTGERFFQTLVRSLAEALGVHGAWVTEYQRDERRLRAIAFWLGGQWVHGYEYRIARTPCEPVVDDPRLVHIPDRVVELYPEDDDLRRVGATSYLGVPLFGLDGEVLGHLAVLDTQPLEEDRRCLAIFQIFAARAASELRRLRLEAAVETRDARLEALVAEAAALREVLVAPAGDGEIVGDSQPVRRMRREIAQVAATDATVLVIGETGTGKELVARAIHAASGRSRAPLVAVNCAAIPATLIESEFFGHEKGAFTGAIQRREGRFALADRGTLFLDEIGELPRDLQPKLLRVLQEGEFEPVGSARPRRVDVRIVAATNRDLEQEVREGRFREDLFYRLNVFPIHVPPLRQRGEDVVRLAEVLMARASRRLGRLLHPLSGDATRRLRAYHWPGNVRELQNVIERAVILAREGHVDLSPALPDPPPAASAQLAVTAAAVPASPPVVRTAREIEEIERRNLLLALEQTDWRIAGAKGAAQLLGLRPSTLASRLKALGLRRPAARHEIS